MNSRDRDLHLISASVVVDGFKTCSSLLTDVAKSWILTHYHADHYTGLKRGHAGRSQVSGTIHCTKVTKALLDRVHFADTGAAPPHNPVVSHDYGAPFCLDGMTFVFRPAHHCPGAAIVLYRDKMKDNQGWNVHCGDMRYDAKSFKLYPEFQNPVNTVFLDSTYGSNSSHTFMPQSEAIATIASSVSEHLKAQNTLILLGCYNIGKEKLLHAASLESRRKLYCPDRKRIMLQAIADAGELDLTSIMTSDPTSTPLHVVPISLLGEMFPYYIPAYRSVADYAHSHGLYENVVAFLPTGHAGTTNWNKKNAISTKTVPRVMRAEVEGTLATAVDPKDTITVTVRLVPYSEHSTYTELCDFLNLIKPARIVPTVYSSSSERAKMEKDFNRFIDRKRAKADLLSSMFKAIPKSAKASSMTELTESSRETTRTPSTGEKFTGESVHPNDTADYPAESLDQLSAMGFPRPAASIALKATKGDVEAAVARLLAPPPEKKARSSTSENGEAAKAAGKSARTLHSFFK